MTTGRKKIHSPSHGVDAFFVDLSFHSGVDLLTNLCDTKSSFVSLDTSTRDQAYIPLINCSISMFSRTLPMIALVNRSADMRGNIRPDVMVQIAW
jgi:hypothetical protein